MLLNPYRRVNKSIEIKLLSNLIVYLVLALIIADCNNQAELLANSLVIGAFQILDELTVQAFNF